MANVLFVFPLTKDSADPPDRFVLKTNAFHIVAEADDQVVKSKLLATDVYLVDVGAVDPKVMQIYPGLSLVNHGAVSRATINQVLLGLVTKAGLVPGGSAGKSQSESISGEDDGSGSVITASLSPTELLTGYTAP